MATRGLSRSLKRLKSRNGRPTTPRRAQKITASSTSHSTTKASESILDPRFGAASVVQSTIPEHIMNPSVTTTIYKFPEMVPLRVEQYPSILLGLPLRRDILHRAVVFEGDKTRQGTASTKWRDDVHGSSRKIRPQKGMGMARLGDKKSPMLRGGGVAFGPKPRDFSTDLPKKIYDLAWRTALSYRYRRGELVIVNEMPPPKDDRAQYLQRIVKANGWTKEGGGHSMFITRQESSWKQLFHKAGKAGRLVSAEEVDVKNLLEMGRLVVEREALDFILQRHQSDLVRPRAAPSIV